MNRREFLSLSGTGAVMMSGCVSNLPQPPTTAEIELHQTDYLYRKSEEEVGDGTHSLRVVREAFRQTLEDLDERLNNFNYTINTSDEPVDIYGFDASQSLQRWYPHDRVSNSDASCVFLLGHSDMNEIAGAYYKNAAVSFTGRSLYHFDPDDIPSERTLTRSDNEELFQAHRALQVSIHELGHTLGFEHMHGHMSNGEPSTTTPMVTGYELDLQNEENKCGHVYPELETSEPQQETTTFQGETIEQRLIDDDPYLSGTVNFSMRFSDCAVNSMEY